MKENKLIISLLIKPWTQAYNVY